MSEHACPFCGGEPHVSECAMTLGYDREISGFAWVCPVCGARGPVRESEGAALGSLGTPAARAAGLFLSTFLPRAVVKVAETLRDGAKTHPPNDWREKGVLGNLDHACGHELLFRRGNNQEEDNLAHGATRFMMSLQLREEGRGDTTD